MRCFHYNFTPPHFFFFYNYVEFLYHFLCQFYGYYHPLFFL
ncbi:CopG family transcriptional regulator [Listeria monocytogenes]|nr:CopG family transcriptional regulator [Listeria monocytogenes]GAT37956.1 CopG family transcriptional regulator [Listeria monocytogenes]